MAKPKMFKAGDRVVAPYKDNREDKSGVITDVLSAMYFIDFDDGTQDFYAHGFPHIRYEDPK